MRSSVGLVVILSCLAVGIATIPSVRVQAQGQGQSFAQGQPPAGMPGQQPPGGPPGAPGAPGQGRAAPPPPQNLKVLPKDWSRMQVQQLMATFMESLGLDNSSPEKSCAHCHAVNPNAPPPQPGRGPALDYALDTNPKKDIARKMIQMVMAANESLKTVTDPPVTEPVSCFTCHRGDSAAKPPSAPANGWTRGGFSLLPPGPQVAGRGRGGQN
jgi:hypothetical protein